MQEATLVHGRPPGAVRGETSEGADPGFATAASAGLLVPAMGVAVVVAPVAAKGWQDCWPVHASLRGANRLVKRGLDVLVSAVAVILLAPLFAVLALAIRLDSPGPVLFRQRRTGLWGREFDCLKFRSMARDAEQQLGDLLDRNEIEGGVIFKMRKDPRVTRVGRFIRATSLDEFPQFWNILRGEMSLVGPRPPIPSEVEAYSSEDMERLTVMPGATGLWQVSGRSGISSFREMVALDRTYIHSWSLLADLRIILKTFGVVLGRKNAF